MFGTLTMAPLLIVPAGTGQAVVGWYQQVLGARERFRVGVFALDVDGAALFIRERTGPDDLDPSSAGGWTAAVELFVDNPELVIERARAAGARVSEIKDHSRPWGNHRQGSFSDLWGHQWMVGDRSPLAVEPET